jgi:RNA polymerase sigma-70 factor (ECF subfamily)
MDDDENTRRRWEVADIAANPEEHCLINDMRRMMDHAICRLPLQLRVVAEMRLVGNLSLAEIASTLNISIPAAKSRLLRAKRRIVVTLRRRQLHTAWETEVETDRAYCSDREIRSSQY